MRAGPGVRVTRTGGGSRQRRVLTSCLFPTPAHPPASRSLSVWEALLLTHDACIPSLCGQMSPERLEGSGKNRVWVGRIG